MSWFNKTPEEKCYEELRKQNMKRKIDETINGAFTGLYENKDKILGAIAIGTALVTGTSKVIGMVDRHNQKKLELERRRQVYDRSMGMYVDLKRPLRQSDWNKINDLKKDGMKTGEALKKLGLIK